MYVYVIMIYPPVSWAGEADGDADVTLSPPSSQQAGLAEADAGAGCARSDEAAVIEDVACDAKAAIGPSAGGDSEGGGVAAAEPPERKRAKAGAPPTPLDLFPILAVPLSLRISFYLLRPALVLSLSPQLFLSFLILPSFSLHFFLFFPLLPPAASCTTTLSVVHNEDGDEMPLHHEYLYLCFL